MANSETTEEFDTEVLEEETVYPEHPRQPGALSPFLTFGSLRIIAGLVAVAAVILLLAGPGGFRLGNLFPGGSSGTAFVAQPDMNREQAEALYRKAVANFQAGDYETALSQFKKLEPAYPGLRDMLWLHQADCYAGQGNEWAVQKKLNAIQSDLRDTPLKTLALYRIGQSQFRGREWDKARDTFDRIQQEKPDSTYAAGSLYYQGALLARTPERQREAADILRQYLRRYADGKFGVEAATLLERLTTPNATPEDHALIGLALAASSNDGRRAMSHLKQGTGKITWHALGMLLIRSGLPASGIQTLASGLPNAKDIDEYANALDTALAAESDPIQKKTLLKTIVAQRSPVGGDYSLWKLAELDEAQAPTYFREIVAAYPKGDYAPESAWRLLWPLLQQNRFREYQNQAEAFMNKYAYARSAPKVLFWIGKVQEKTSIAEALQTYTQIRDKYAGTYYAFRADGRLKALSGGQDPGWKLAGPTNAAYPGKNTDLGTLDIMPSADQFGSGQTGNTLRDEAIELQRIGVPEDVRLFVTEAVGSLPAAVESWADQVGGERAKGIRTIRTALDKKSRQAMQGLTTDKTQGMTINSVVESATAIAGVGSHKDDYKLLYPVYFSEFIGPTATKTGVDPFLIQALMREESYFNELAVSGSNARGLMQLLPGTAGDVARWENMPTFKTADLFIPQVNIRLGSRYLSYLINHFNGNAMPAVGAYNGGPGAMGRWIVASSTTFTGDPDMFVERIPYGQSRDYIKKVFAGYWNYQQLYGR